MKSLISIIVPVFGVEKYLERCLKSISEQTYKHLEIILVDDGSPDKCGEICDNWAKKDKRIKVIHKSNGGLSSARNAGLNIATGDYIGFVDSDDYIAPNMYENLFNAIQGKSKFVIGNIMSCRVDKNGVETSSAVPYCEDTVITKEEYIGELLMHKGDSSSCTKLFSAEMIADIRFVEGKCNEDLLFMFDILERLDYICFVGEIGYYYYVREGSISCGFGNAVCDMVDNSMLVYKYILENAPNLKSKAKRFVAYQHMAYLLLVPDERVTDQHYKTSLSRVRKMCCVWMLNRYLTIKQKIIIVGLSVCPRHMAHIYQKRGEKK